MKLDGAGYQRDLLQGRKKKRKKGEKKCHENMVKRTHQIHSALQRSDEAKRL